jgi:hypothetical protein
MQYRDHKGNFRESMLTVQEVQSIEDIKTHLNAFYTSFLMFVEEIKLVHIGYDDRNGWDTYYVMQRLGGEQLFTVAGMTDGNF